MQPLTPDDVRAALHKIDPTIEITLYAVSTATSELAADAIGCEVAQIAKSICFMVDSKPVVIVTSGDQQVDDRKIAGLFNVGRKKVKMAKPEECIAIFGYAPGSVPPIGHRAENVTVYLDETLQRHTTVYPAGGSASAIFKVSLAQLQAITQATFADVVRTGGEPSIDPG
jgi:prolyl-tRNA editing enzyme YbaK/EbsC (Cys-tRNA(Pro) deacylase)